MKHLKKIFGIFLFLIGVVLISGSQSGITGNAISETASAFGNIFGLVFVVIGILIILSKRGEGGISSGKSLENLTLKDKLFRKNFIHLLEIDQPRVPVDPKKIAYIIPRYDKVRKTQEYIPGHNYPVFQGRIGKQEEYFTIDTREVLYKNFGGKIIPLPSHIDIQERLDTNKYKKVGKENIPWDSMYKSSKSEDITNFYNRVKNKRKHK